MSLNAAHRFNMRADFFWVAHFVNNGKIPDRHENCEADGLGDEQNEQYPEGRRLRDESRHLIECGMLPLEDKRGLW